MRRRRLILQLGARHDIRSLGRPLRLWNKRAANTASCPAAIPVRAAKTCPDWQKTPGSILFRIQGGKGWTAVIARFEADLVERAVVSRRRGAYGWEAAIARGGTCCEG